MEEDQLNSKLDKTIAKVCEKNNPFIEIYKNKLDKLLKDYDKAQKEIASLNLSEPVSIFGMDIRSAESISLKN